MRAAAPPGLVTSEPACTNSLPCEPVIEAKVVPAKSKPTTMRAPAVVGDRKEKRNVWPVVEFATDCTKLAPAAVAEARGGGPDRWLAWGAFAGSAQEAMRRAKSRVGTVPMARTGDTIRFMCGLGELLACRITDRHPASGAYRLARLGELKRFELTHWRSRTGQHATGPECGCPSRRANGAYLRAEQPATISGSAFLPRLEDDACA